LNSNNKKMPANQPTIDQLTQFRQRDPFSYAAWEARGLNPSGDHVSAPLRTLFHTCADQLSSALSAGNSKKQLRAILLSTLATVNARNYDTEEREFICDLFTELATIVGANIRSNLNSWLYGYFLATLLTLSKFLRPRQRVVATYKQPCRQCSTPLETQILRKQSGIRDHNWNIVKCSHCGDLNLLSLGPDIKQARFVNYTMIEQLPKDEFTADGALIRLEQIKYFRKT